MTNEKLIEEARGFAAGSDSARATLLRDMADALEAAEKAHTPTDDEREALMYAMYSNDVAQGRERTLEWYRGNATAILAAGFRRSEIPEQSGGEKKGEPSDAQELLDEADALIDVWDRKGSWTPDSPIGLVMRLAAALRAAGDER